MTAERPDRRIPRAQPPLDRAAGPTGIAAVLPAAFVILLAVVIIALVLFGGWVASGFALALLLLGVVVLSRYVQRVAWTRSSPERLRGGLSGMNEDLRNGGGKRPSPSPRSPTGGRARGRSK